MLRGSSRRATGPAMRSVVHWIAGLSVSFAVACSSSTPESAPANAGTPTDPAACARDAKCATTLPGHEIGTGDGTAGSVDLTEIYAPGAKAQPVDLAFHSERTDELWVIGYGDDAIHVGTGIGSDAPAWKRFLDPAARHFAHKPPALAMGAKTSSTGDGTTWASCGDNDNGQNAQESDGTANLFVGPSLFSGDPTVYSKRTPQGLGSHLDMLHESPFCRGIAHVEANVYWVFNAYDKALDLYDFAGDHGPGNDDHSNGVVMRYAQGQVKGATDGTPSHLFFDASDSFLYVADTGNQRIVRLDTKSGTKSGRITRVLEPLKDQGVMKDATIEVVVDTGVLTAPSGLEVKGDLIFVTDAATSTFHVFDKSGTKVRSLETGLPPGSLAGFTFGPDGKIYFADKVGGRVLRIDPR